MARITLHSAFTIMYHSNIVIFESSCSSSNIVVLVLVCFHLEQLEYPRSISQSIRSGMVAVFAVLPRSPPRACIEH